MTQRGKVAFEFLSTERAYCKMLEQTMEVKVFACSTNTSSDFYEPVETRRVCIFRCTFGASHFFQY